MSEIRCPCMPKRPWPDAEDEAFWKDCHALHVKTIEAIDKLIRDRAEARARADAERAEARKHWPRSPLLKGETEEEIEAELARMRADLGRWRAEDEAQQ